MIFQMIDKLAENRTLSDVEFLYLLREIKTADPEVTQYLYKNADAVRRSIYGNQVFIRGLIEISNICKNDCYYCGIRKSNPHAERYRLSPEVISDCCRKGYELGFRTFVLQGGEDAYFNDERMCEIIASIRKEFPDCAITLSLGEKTKESYQRLFDAGADRYLLRHETADFDHYRMLHPEPLSGEERQQCLYDLKEIGYQVGCGIMLSSPGQTDEHILKDLRFMEMLQPHMIGIGPFIAHKDTPFKDKPSGNLEDTLHLLAILRLMFPRVLLPATTALGTIHPYGREMGIQAGANVIMPNLSPESAKKKYVLYDGKIGIGDETVLAVENLKERMKSIGYEVVVSRGDFQV